MNKTKKKLLSFLLTANAISAIPATQIHAAGFTGWKQTSSGWTHFINGYQTKDTVCYINDKLYAFDKNGIMLTGLQTIGSKTYYFDSSGAALKNAWKSINGKWYYFSEGNLMLKNQRKTIDGHDYLFKEDGHAHTGWQQASGSWYYYRKNCMLAQNGWQQIGSNWYYFDSEGHMKTGWIKDSGKEYYCKASGEMVTGTFTINGVDYTFNRDGSYTGNSTKPNLPVYPDEPDTPTKPVDKSEYNRMTEAEYNAKVQEFLSNPAYQDGAPWGGYAKPLTTDGGGVACGAYRIDFGNIVYGNWMNYKQVFDDDASHIRTGDALSVNGGAGGHALVILYRNGDTLYTAEGNFAGKVRVMNGYRIVGNKLVDTQRGVTKTIYRINHYLPEDLEWARGY